MAAVDQELCFALYSANHAMAGLYKGLLDPLGITYPQYLVLLVLWETDGRTVGQLGRSLRLDSNTLTPLLKRMEAAGLVTRARDAADERRVTVTLTGHGRALRAGASHVPVCISAGSGLATGALRALQADIMRLRDSLEAAVTAAT